MWLFSFKTRTRKKRQQYLAGDDRSVTSIPEQLRCKEKKKPVWLKWKIFVSGEECQTMTYSCQRGESHSQVNTKRNWIFLKT